jgi:hypothetical protein
VRGIFEKNEKKGDYFARPFAKCERVLYYRSGGKSPALGRRSVANKCGAKRFKTELFSDSRLLHLA